jgi:hypothetical protein
MPQQHQVVFHVGEKEAILIPFSSAYVSITADLTITDFQWLPGKGSSTWGCGSLFPVSGHLLAA